MARLDQHHSFSADWHTSEPTPAETSAGRPQCASRHWRAPHFRETMDHPGDKAHCYHQHPVVKRKAPPGSGGLLLSGHHRNRPRGRKDLGGLHRRHGRRRGLRWSLRSLHRHPARGRLGRAGRRGFVAHAWRRNTILRHRKQTVPAGYGVRPNAGTWGPWSRLCHTGCGGHHPERCERYGGCRRRDNFAHSTLADQRRQPVTLERHLALWPFPRPHLVGHASDPQAKRTPTEVAVDGSGTVYVTDTGNNRVLKPPAG